jgi:hypothetical protein
MMEAFLAKAKLTHALDAKKIATTKKKFSKNHHYEKVKESP